MRFVHHKEFTATNHPQAFDQGRRQYKLAEERFHYLCAAIQGSYTLKDNIPPDVSRGQLFPRQGLDFSSYWPYNLQPVIGVKLHPREDGTIHEGDLKVYVSEFKKNWKCREGGVLYCISEDSRAFWNMILHYHSRAGTTGIPAWDALFERMKESGYSPSLVPCMFFARESGCLYAKCPFLHDKEACIEDREKVLQERRRVLRKPTMRELSLRWQGAQGAAFDKLHKETPNISMVCYNPTCLKVQYKDPPAGYSNPDMRVCSRCKAAHYCSSECQRSDWKRHKTEPCLPFDELVNNDDLWTTWGTRKGTGNVNFHIDED
ncbi:hypothetical protein K474DRAFT_1624182 [Panus rudis PR-1116 ss-1]|nr:hypothetical protein K474DRAFT_1624182 [Panus rudis PR-1116 ss-1]